MVFVPRDTPNEIVEKLNQVINQALELSDVKDKFDKAGLIPLGGSLGQTSTYIALELKHWEQVVKMTDARVD